MVCEDPILRGGLIEALIQDKRINYTIDKVPSAEEAQRQLLKPSIPYDILIGNFVISKSNSINFFANVSKISPTTLQLLITDENPLNYHEASGNLNLFQLNDDYCFDSLVETVTSLLVPDYLWGAENYLKNNSELNHFTLTSTADIAKYQDEIETYLSHFPDDRIKMFLVPIVEAMTNAVYHAIKDLSGSDVYGLNAEIEHLDENHQVMASYGHDENKIVFGIRDQGGTLDPEEFIGLLKRKAEAKNALNESEFTGSGIYLMHMLSNKLVINIDPGKFTEFILIKSLGIPSDKSKPIRISYKTT